MGRRHLTDAPREAGTALTMVLFSITALSLAVGTALHVCSADILATRNYVGAVQAHYVAQSAILEALQAVNVAGVVRFEADVVDRWPRLWAPARRPFAANRAFTYTVTAEPGTEAGGGRLVATATGPDETRSVLVASVARVDVPSAAPGALLLTQDAPTAAVFTGGPLVIDGNDRPYGTRSRSRPGRGARPPVLGIAARNATNARQVTTALRTARSPEIAGLGFRAAPPGRPSVSSTPAAPSRAQLERIVETLRLGFGVVTIDADALRGRWTLGTRESPRVTHLRSPSGVTLAAGRTTGAGVLIVDRDLVVRAPLEFAGLVIVRGRLVVDVPARGRTSIDLHGSLWAADASFVAGPVAIRYSTDALGLATAAARRPSLPTPLVVTSLVDCTVAPCPDRRWLRHVRGEAPYVLSFR